MRNLIFLSFYLVLIQSPLQAFKTVNPTIYALKVWQTKGGLFSYKVFIEPNSASPEKDYNGPLTSIPLSVCVWDNGQKSCAAPPLMATSCNVSPNGQQTVSFDSTGQLRVSCT